jgi:hypothetical protein
MFPRRLLTCLARFVLAWFVLHVGAGIAAPVLQPNALQMICAGTGLKLVTDSGGDKQVVTGTLDCPLCSPALAPPPVPAGMPLVQAAPSSHFSLPRPVTWRASLAPPPARGPPAAILA